jgi:hypothetical protein
MLLDHIIETQYASLEANRSENALKVAAMSRAFSCLLHQTFSRRAQLN